MNARYLALALITATGAAAAAATTRSKPVVARTTGGGPRVVGRWDGTTAFAYAGACQTVYAMSPTSAGYTRRAGAITTDSCGFQCVELAVRYFHYRKGIPASRWVVSQATDMCNRRVPGVTRRSNPMAGDLVVLRANDRAVGTGAAGHVAVVTGVRGNTISTFNQNWAHDATAFGSVSRSDVLCFLHAGR
jgi:hypothetical protein